MDSIPVKNHDIRKINDAPSYLHVTISIIDSVCKFIGDAKACLKQNDHSGARENSTMAISMLDTATYNKVKLFEIGMFRHFYICTSTPANIVFKKPKLIEELNLISDKKELTIDLLDQDIITCQKETRRVGDFVKKLNRHV